MGCDIHMVLEVYDTDERIWVGLHDYRSIYPQALSFLTDNYGDPKEKIGHTLFKVQQRDYALFGALAGVRGENVFGWNPKGVPKDASTLTSLMVKSDGSDGHSHSYLSVAEFVEALAYVRDKTSDIVAERLSGEGKAKTYRDLVKEATGVTSAHEDLRIVFWFDN